jgi:hypothetical protein
VLEAQAKMATVPPNVTPLPSNVVPFAFEFVKRMRSISEVKVKPSIRKGNLSLDDFVEAAVCTTYPSDQELARLIAEDILLGRKRDEKRQEVKVESTPQVIPKEDPLQKVIEQIKREQELAKKINKDKVQQGFDYLQELRKRKDTSLYRAVMDYLTEGDVVLRGLSNDEELRKEASSELLEHLGNLESSDIMNSKTLGVLDQVCNAPHAAERLAGQSLRGDQDIPKKFEDLAQRDPATASKALRYLEEMGTHSKEELERMDQALQDSLNDLQEAAQYSAELKRAPNNMQQHVSSAPKKYPLVDAIEFAEKIKQNAHTDISEQLLEAYSKQYGPEISQNVDMRQLAETARNSSHWEDLVDKETSNLTEKASSRSSPSDYLRQKILENSSLKSRISDTSAQKKWQESMEKMADQAVRTSPTKLHLRQTVRACSNLGASPSQDAIKESGQKLSMTDDEILELLNPSFQVIKKLIQKGVSNFDRLHDLMKTAGLSQSQLQELADLAYSKGNQTALGAIAHIDLGIAMGMPKGRRGYGGKGSGSQMPINSKRADMAFGGLLGGPATNIVKIWYSYRDEMPPELRSKLRDIAKQLLVDLGMRYARQTMGSSMLGGIQQSTTVRPFRIGDDPELIDLEETIDSLLSQGRHNFDVMDPEDFLITETYHGHRAFFWALDKSGSMDSPDKLGMLAISVMAGLYGVQKDDFGVVLFDSTTHVVKRIPDRNVSSEKVATDLLEVRASGGTGGASSITLALEDFEETRAKEKIFLFNTDMYLSDQKRCEELAELMKQRGIKVIVLVPKPSYNIDASKKLVKASHGVVLDLSSIDELPARLLRITNY